MDQVDPDGSSRVYKVLMKYQDGSTSLLDDEFETEGEAAEYGLYLCGCYTQGGEILHLSNPGDHPLSDDEADCEVVEA